MMKCLLLLYVSQLRNGQQGLQWHEQSAGYQCGRKMKGLDASASSTAIDHMNLSSRRSPAARAAPGDKRLVGSKAAAAAASMAPLRVADAASDPAASRDSL